MVHSRKGQIANQRADFRAPVHFGDPDPDRCQISIPVLTNKLAAKVVESIIKLPIFEIFGYSRGFFH